jgi:hypothetical protein
MRIVKNKTSVYVTTEEIKQLVALAHHLNMEEFDLFIEDDSVQLTDKVDSPWYPDNSGEWVECSDVEMPPELDPDTQVYWLLDGERIDREFHKTSPETASELDWSGIVAYKVAS